MRAWIAGLGLLGLAGCMTTNGQVVTPTQQQVVAGFQLASTQIDVLVLGVQVVTGQPTTPFGAAAMKVSADLTAFAAAVAAAQPTTSVSQQLANDLTALKAIEPTLSAADAVRLEAVIGLVANEVADYNAAAPAFGWTPIAFQVS